LDFTVDHHRFLDVPASRLMDVDVRFVVRVTTTEVEVDRVPR